jgi:hypothetical protein
MTKLSEWDLPAEPGTDITKTHDVYIREAYGGIDTDIRSNEQSVAPGIETRDLPDEKSSHSPGRSISYDQYLNISPRSPT